MLIKNSLFSRDKKQTFNPAFTIVELLVVIVVIGILAAISLVSYAGITERAIAARLQSDLSNNTKLLELYKIEHDEYPATLDDGTGGTNCPVTPEPDDQYCLKVSEDDDILTYEGDGGTGGGAGDTYTLTITDDDSNTSFEIVPGGTPIAIESGGVSPANTFAVTLGGDQYDEAKSIIQTNDGGYAVTGMTYSFGAVVADMFIAKFDSIGNVVWDKTWGGADYEEGNSIAQTADGGYVVTGYTASFGAVDQDMFIVKYDSVGNIVWDNTMVGVNDSAGYSIIQASDGSYVAVGSTTNGMLIAKYDSAGSVLWSKTWGETGSAYGSSIVQTADGGYAVTGETNSYDAGNGDMFIVKYDSSGNVLWDKTWGGADNDSGSSIVQTADGGYAVTGETNSYDAGNGDMFIVKYDSSGNVLWDKTWGGAEQERVGAISKSNNGSYVITGATNSYGAGSGDMFIVKYDSDGNILWEKTWGGADDYEIGKSITQTSDGGVAVTGKTNSFGDGYDNIFIAKYDLNGNITGCPSSICKNITAGVSSPTAGVSNPTGSVSNLTTSVSSPVATVSSPNAVMTTITPPSMTFTFSSNELRVLYPGEDQTVCKEWTTPPGKMVKGFMVSQETEDSYDFFIVSLDGVEKYNKSGYKTDEYVNTSAAPGTTLSACMSADDSTQDGYGGQVTGVLYD